MLPKLYRDLDASATPKLEIYYNKKLQNSFRAFPWGKELRFVWKVPRKLGASAVVLRYEADGKDWVDLPLTFCSTELGTDTYEGVLESSLLFSKVGGLLFYEFLFLRGNETLFTDSKNNLDFGLEASASERFRIFFYQKDFSTPAWFCGGTMYHIFADRFYKGAGAVTCSPNAILEEDWENGIPEFPEKPGDALANNRFFGGNLWGVCEKLDYLKSLGVTVLYLSPIFKAASNHRYDTGNYEEIDGLLGGLPAFTELCDEAHARGMKIILDGVFNHTGDDSLYFNRRGSYPSVGAYQSKESCYYPWYSFRSYPDNYECWWGIEILPRLNHEAKSCRSYFTGKGGIAERWIAAGADGWRLDVADELSDDFLDEFRVSVKSASSGNALILGEVWENATEKIAYGKRRRYFGGAQLDSVMNYPFRNAVLALLKDRDVESFADILTEIYSLYPKPASDALMNLLGTHDTERILTVLGAEDAEGLCNRELAQKRLTEEQKKKAVALLKIASTLQYTVYGVPSLYYGDEAGLQGYHDPFCRMPFPWKNINGELLEHYRFLGTLRASHTAFAGGEFRFLFRDDKSFVFERKNREERILVGVNLRALPTRLSESGSWKEVFSGKTFENEIELLPQKASFFVSIHSKSV